LCGWRKNLKKKMLKTGTTIKINFPNEAYHQNIPLNVVKDWNPTDVRTIGTTTFFKTDSLTLSMNSDEFAEIFNIFNDEE
jgi:hypothetical protein